MPVLVMDFTSQLYPHLEVQYIPRFLGKKSLEDVTQ